VIADITTLQTESEVKAQTADKAEEPAAETKRQTLSRQTLSKNVKDKRREKRVE
jgi:hypothetical protein